MGEPTPRDGVPRITGRFLGDTWGGWLRWGLGLAGIALAAWLAMRDQVQVLASDLDHHRQLGHRDQQQQLDDTRSQVRDLQEDIRAIRRATDDISSKLGDLAGDVKELRRRPR